LTKQSKRENAKVQSSILEYKSNSEDMNPGKAAIFLIFQAPTTLFHIQVKQYNRPAKLQRRVCEEIFCSSTTNVWA